MTWLDWSLAFIGTVLAIVLIFFFFVAVVQNDYGMALVYAVFFFFDLKVVLHKGGSR